MAQAGGSALFWRTVAGLLACVVGVAWQTSEARLAPERVYLVGIVVGLFCAGVAGFWRAGPDRQGRSAAFRLAASVAAGVLLAWGSTGWRATQRMAEAWPAEWARRDLSICVQIEGLPRPMPGGAVQADAVLLATDVPDCDAAHLAQAHPLVRHIGLYGNWPVASPGVTAPQAGQTWWLMARLHPPDGASNPGGFDAPLQAFDKDVRAIGTVRHRMAPPRLVTSGPTWSWVGAIDRLRQRIRDGILQRVSDARAAGVLAGLAVGDQSAIDREDWDVFRRTGVAHVVSISGTHIAMLGCLAAMVCRPLWARWRWGRARWPAPEAARWLAVLASVLYALLAGWGVPAQRTVLMMGVMAALQSGGRRWPWALVWLLAAVVVLAWDPWALRQAGFWLSFVAVGVLMSAGTSPTMAHDADVGAGATGAPEVKPPEPPAPDHAASRLPTGIARLADAARAASRRGLHATQAASREMVQTQYLVTLALTPLALVCFQQVSIVGAGANLVAIPLFTLLITPLALAGVLCPWLWDFGAWLVQLALAGLGAASALPLAVAQAPVVPGWAAAMAVLGGVLGLQPWARPWRWLVWPCMLPLFWLPVGWRLLPPPPPGHFDLLAADVGQGTAVLVRTAHHQLLFDTGPRLGSQGDAGAQHLLPLLRALAVDRLDTLVISHEDNDHVGGAASIVAGLPVATLRSSLAPEHPLLAQPGVQGLRPVHTPCLAGQSWDWEGVRFTFLHPTPADLAQRSRLPPNALSCVLKVEGPGGRSALLTGDIEAAQERALLARTGAGLKSTVLTVPHHGSTTSSTGSFLAAVAPEVAVIQAGRRNGYGHPAPAVLRRYADMGLPLRSTPRCGAWWWSSASPAAGDGQGRCWRDIAPRYWYPPDAPD